MTTLYVLLFFLASEGVEGYVRHTGWPWIYQPTYLYGRYGFLYNVVPGMCLGNDYGENPRSEICATGDNQKWILRYDNRIQPKSPVDKYLDPIGWDTPVVGTQVKTYPWSLTKDEKDAQYYAHFPDELPMIFELHLLYWSDLCLEIFGNAVTTPNYLINLATCGMNLQTDDHMWQFFPACEQAQTSVEFVVFDDEVSNSRLRRNDKLHDNDTSTCVTLWGPSRIRLYISKPTGSDYTVNLTVSSDLQCDKIVVMGKISDNIDLAAITYRPTYSKCAFDQAIGDICQYSCSNDFAGLLGACDEVFVDIPRPGGSICEAMVSSP